MASVARIALRVPSRASGLSSKLATRTSTSFSRPSATNRPVLAAAATRTFSSSSVQLNKHPLAPKEVPVSVYSADGAVEGEHFKVPIEQTSSAPLTNPIEDPVPDTVTPLKEEVYNAMPKTLQNMSIMGKVVVVTGGARGLGYCMARACAEAGAKSIALLDTRQEEGDQAAQELSRLSGVPTSFLQVDIRHPEAINTAVSQVVELFGVPDVLVNSAGIADSNIPAETYDATMFRRLIDINLNGAFFMAQAVGREMMAAKKPGSIILVASMSGSIVNFPQEQSCYNASKAGVIQLGKSLAAEWAKYDIRVNTISPGYMDTALNQVPALDAQKKIWKGRTPQNRLGSVSDLNGLCVFLASDASGFMTGSDVIIDGGYTLY